MQKTAVFILALIFLTACSQSYDLEIVCSDFDSKAVDCQPTEKIEKYTGLTEYNIICSECPSKRGFPIDVVLETEGNLYEFHHDWWSSSSGTSNVNYCFKSLTGQTEIYERVKSHICNRIAGEYRESCLKGHFETKMQDGILLSLMEIGLRDGSRRVGGGSSYCIGSFD